MTKTNLKRWNKASDLARRCAEVARNWRDSYGKHPDIWPEWAEQASAFQRLSALYYAEARRIAERAA